MSRFFRYVLPVFLLVVLSSFTVHKYYVSVFQVDYIPHKKILQMTSRIFVDDLEAAFQKKYGKKFYLSEKRELPEAGDYIAKYISEKVQVKVNGKAQAIKFLGKEMEDDVLVCYYTISAEEKITRFEMTNTTLFEMFDEQQNIIHIKTGSNKKSLLLTNDERSGVLAF